MKRSITKLMAALALLVFMAPSMVMWGQTRASETITFAELGLENGVQYTDPFGTNISVTFGGGGNDGKYYTTGAGIRTYGGGTITITALGNTVTAISTTFSAAGYAPESNDVWTSNGTGTGTSGVNASWSGTATEVVMTRPSGSGHWRLQAITVTYSTGGPEIATPTFSPIAGLYTTSQSVTISCETEGTTIYYTVDGTTPDDESTEYTAPITVDQTMTIKAIAYDGDDNTSSVATAKYSILEHAGTESDPYSVADARAAIDANAGTQGVYATGIVSAIPTEWSTQYNNITFNFVDENGDEDFLQAFRCVSTDNADASTVAIGDIVVVYGNLTKYNATYEFGQGCQLVSLEHPTNFVEAPTFSPVAGTYTEAQSVTISCETPNVTIYYTTDGTDPDDEGTAYTEPIAVSETMTIKAIAYDAQDNNSAIATANYYFCSAEDPYTVTEALTFASYQYPANGIYVEGIVSTAADNLNNGTLTYYISVDGEATNELEVYKGKGLNNEAFTAVDDIQVGDIVTIYGNVQVYNGTIEFASGNYLVSFERPETPAVLSITVAPATLDVDAEEHEGSLGVEFVNFWPDTETCDIQYYDAEGTELEENPDWILAEIGTDPESGDFALLYMIEANEGEARTAYFKLYAMDDETNLVYSNLVTVNQAAYVAPALDYATLPFEFDGGRADIETTDGLTQEGLDSDYGSSPKLKFNTTGDWLLLHFNEVPGVLTFDIKGNTFSGGTFTVQTSVDGETYTDLASYTELGNTQHETFNNLASDVRYIKWIYTEKVSGNVALGNITLAQPAPFISVEFDEIEVTATGEDDYAAITYGNLEITEASDFDVQFYDAEGEEPTEAPDWISAEVTTQDGEEGYFVYYVIDDNEGAARSAYFKVYAMDDETNLVYSNLVTITQEAYEAPATGALYALYTGELVEGDYLIVYDGGAMNNTVTSDRLQFEAVTATNDVITTDNASIVWHIAPSGEYWTIYSADANAYAASTGAKNKAQMLADGTDDMALWTVSGTETYEFVNKKNVANSVNANLRKNGTYGFACYATSTGGALSLYKKVALDITGYGNSAGGYYLIASPVTVNPSNVQGMTEGNFDLYYFDEREEDEWINYEGNDGNFDLVPGKGYLYAHDTDVTLTFTGELYDGDGTVTLTKQGTGNVAGWNLVGNPYLVPAYIGRDFYVMNEEGSEIVTGEGDVIAPMQGIFVIADEDGETMTFTTEEPATPEGSKIVMNVTNERSNLVDRAMIRFGEGRQLPKFMFNDENTKLYIAQGEEEFAVVRSIEESTTPVSFHAAENGTYTLSVNADEVEMDYLHLVDNMTGADVDLLATPSYTFEARTTDYPSRFTLVYAAANGVNENGMQPFAFFNGTSWTVNNAGEATLQVVDMMGRIVRTEQVNDNVNINLNETPGVYMLRLVNGNDVKVQKIVIK